MPLSIISKDASKVHTSWVIEIIHVPSRLFMCEQNRARGRYIPLTTSVLETK